VAKPHRLYANENFPQPVVNMLRDTYGYDITSTHEQGKSGRGIEDRRVLSHAVANERAVITQNWRDFEHLHAASGKHFGIVVCEVDADIARQAKNVHGALDAHESLDRELIKVYRRASPGADHG
jgi:predicted nuclease of predicted toxin-antitoxin system